MANDHIEKPNIMLATKNTGRWMVLSSSAGNEKRRYRMKYHSLNQQQQYFQKLWQVERVQRRAQKTYMDIQTVL